MTIPAGNDGSMVFNPRLRELIYVSLRPPVLRNVARHAHNFFAGSCARAFGREAGVQSVTLRGGTLLHFLPAISDIDLTLHVEEARDGEAWGRRLLKLRKTYCHLKTYVPALGEVLVLDSVDRAFLASSRSFLLFSASPERVLWGESLYVDASLGVSDEGRMLAAITLYESAFQKMHSFATGDLSRLKEAEIRRNLRKILRQGGWQTRPQDSMVSLFAQAFDRIDDLAWRLLVKKYPVNETDQLGDCRSKNLEDLSDEANPSLKWWTSVSARLRNQGRLLATKNPRRFLWQATSAIATTSLFETLINHSGSDFFPISVLSPAAETCRLMGLIQDPALLGIPEIPDTWFEQPEKHLPLLAFIRARTYEMAVMQYFLLPYHYLALSWDRTREWIVELCARTMMLETGTFAHGHGPTDKSSLLHTAALRREMEDPEFDPYDPGHFPALARALAEIRTTLTKLPRM